MADSTNNRVQKFDAEGNFIAILGSFGTGNRQFTRPSFISLDSSDNIYVVDTGNSRVQKFDARGGFLLKFGSRGSEDGQFLRPQGIAIDSVGNIYVADSDNHRVQRFDAQGKFIAKFGSLGAGAGQLWFPNAIALDINDNIYLVDSRNDRVQVFKPEIIIENNFSDLVFGGTTSGTIVDSGDQNLDITEEPNPAGVRIAADNSGGPKSAIIGACGDHTTFNLDAGDEIIVTCGSAILDVLNGTVDITFTLVEGFTATGTLGQGNGITFDPDTYTITAPADNPGVIPLVVEVNGKKSSTVINPGQVLKLLVNELVIQIDDPKVKFDSEPKPGGPKGTFTITATFTNTSAKTIKHPLFVVDELSRGNLLLNADNTAGGPGATLTPDVGDEILAPGESMTVDFIIGLQDTSSFTFLVDLLGVLES